LAPGETIKERMSAKLWSLGTFLVALGIAAYAVGWDTLLWVPRRLVDSLLWVPGAILETVRTSPATAIVIGLGIVLMVAARLIGRHRG
jgi:hypothetical protein